MRDGGGEERRYRNDENPSFLNSYKPWGKDFRLLAKALLSQREGAERLLISYLESNTYPCQAGDEEMKDSPPAARWG